MTTMNTTQLTAALDATGEPWNVWRAADKTFCISLGEGRQDAGSREVSASEFDEALVLALASPRLPVIPRRPYLYHYEYAKLTGGGPRPYKVLKDGGAILHLDRKGKAVDAASECQRTQTLAIDEWVTQHAHYVDTHTEGVDFYWER